MVTARDQIGVGNDMRRLFAAILANPHVQMAIRDRLQADKVPPDFDFFEGHLPSAQYHAPTEYLLAEYRGRSWNLLQFWYNIVVVLGGAPHLRFYLLAAPGTDNWVHYHQFHADSTSSFNAVTTMPPRKLWLPHNYGVRITYNANTGGEQSVDFYGSLVNDAGAKAAAGAAGSANLGMRSWVNY